MLSFLSIFTAITLLGSTSLEVPIPLQKQPEIMAQHQFSLENRYDVPSVNKVFKDNILLTITYLEGNLKAGNSVNWDQVRSPLSYSFKLDPGQTFAFHDQVLPKYQGKIIKTTNAHFNSTEGFESDGYLIGDGVCHLASLMYWTAKDAGLQVEAPTNHDFMKINEVPKEDGVAIYTSPGVTGSASQNLYITNNQNSPVRFDFDYDGQNLKITAEKIS